MQAFKSKKSYESSKETINVIGKIEFKSKVFPSSSNADQVTLLLVFNLINGIKVESPSPTNMQNMALAILPVIAISPKPFFVIANDALRSAKQFPQQSRVSARNLGYRDNINPKLVSKSIIMFETNAIHDTDWMNAITANKNIKLLDAYSLVVLNLI